jgi:acetyl-CoA synthetase
MPFNLAQLICSRHEDSVFRTAIEEVRPLGSNTYTFGGLDYLSDKFATVLQNCGIRQDDAVAVILSPSAAFIVAHFGILKSGAMVAPFNLQSPKDLLNSVLKEIQAKVIVIDEALFNECEKLVIDAGEILVFIASDYVSKSDFGNQAKGFWREINLADADFKLAVTDETSPAYVFFEQKVMNLEIKILNHGSILSPSQLKMQPEYKSSGEAVLSYASCNWNSTDTLLKELLTALYAGHQIRIGDQTG